MRHHDTNGNGDVLGLLADALCEHNDDAAPPETWPSWCDDVIVALGPAWSRAQSFDDDDDAPLPGEEVALTQPPDDWPLTDQADLILLIKLNTTPWTRWLARPGEIE